MFQNLNLHYQQHDAEAKKLVSQSNKPVPPRTSINIDPSKLPPQEQAAALQAAGVPASPDSIQQDRQLAPHEVTTKEKGVGPTGTEYEHTTSVVGKAIS